jgi:DMSO/TMAO reductase YedYZ molybdopterin-dependent catalytic subunit
VVPVETGFRDNASEEVRKMLDRRELMKRAGLAAIATGFGSVGALAQDTVTLPFDNGERPLVKYPQKRAMIGLTSRPPQIETPFHIFDDGPVTPNNAFFVRYHLAGIPLDIDPDKFNLEVKGKIDRPLKLSLKEIKKLKPVELVAVNQCSGNSRGFFNPRVAGGQLGNGAMGNARWRGVPLKTVLDMAGVQQDAKQVTFNGMDGPVFDRRRTSSRRSISITPATAR